MITSPSMMSAVGTPATRQSGIEPPPAEAVLVQNSSQRSGSGTTESFSWSAPPEIGNRIVVQATGWVGAGGPTMTVTDNASSPNTYTQRGYVAAGTTSTAIFDAVIESIPTSTTVNYSASADHSATFNEWSGLTEYDTSATDGSVTPVSPFPIGPSDTLGQANELVISSFGCTSGNNDAGIAVPDGFTSLGIEQQSSSFIGHGGAYLVVDSTDPVTASWVVGNDTDGSTRVGVLAAYKIG